MPRLHTLLQRHVLSRPALSFLLLGVAFFVFGACTLNLWTLLVGTLRLLREDGWQAAMEGGLRQLAELVATGYVGIAAYVVLKACEHRCVRWLCDEPH
jgi:hypothetical protein